MPQLVEVAVTAGDGVRLRVRVAGEGPAVLLLHGFPDSGECWRLQVGPLVDAGFQVVLPDLRGFGGSERPGPVGSYRMPVLLADVTAILAAVGRSSASVVGHDWGAALAWQLARTRPELVERLAVLSVGHGGVPRTLEQYRRSWYMLWFLTTGAAEAALPAADWAFFRAWGWAGAAPGADPDCDRQIADLARPGALTAGLNWYRANLSAEHFVRPDGRPPVPDVHCPTLGVWSCDDPFLTEQQMTGSAGFVDGGWRYERLPGDHWLPVHSAPALNPLLLDFLT